MDNIPITTTEEIIKYPLIITNNKCYLFITFILLLLSVIYYLKIFKNNEKYLLYIKKYII